MRLSSSCVALWSALLALTSGLSGCPGSLDDPLPFEEALEGGAGDGGACGDVPSTIFTTSCGQGACHNPTAMAEGLDLLSPGVAGRLIDQPAIELPDSGLLLINSTQPDQSVVLTKLETGEVPFGAQMPYLQTPLSAAQIECVHAWILAQVGAGGPGAPDAGDTADGGTE